MVLHACIPSNKSRRKRPAVQWQWRRMCANGLRGSPCHEEDRDSSFLPHVTTVISTHASKCHINAFSGFKIYGPLLIGGISFMFLPRCHKQLIGTHGNQYDSGEEYHTGSDQKFQSRRDLESWEHMGSFLVTLLPAASIQGCETGEMENHVKRSTCHVSRMYNWNLYCHIAPLCVHHQRQWSQNKRINTGFNSFGRGGESSKMPFNEWSQCWHKQDRQKDWTPKLILVRCMLMCTQT